MIPTCQDMCQMASKSGKEGSATVVTVPYLASSPMTTNHHPPMNNNTTPETREFLPMTQDSSNCSFQYEVDANYQENEFHLPEDLAENIIKILFSSNRQETLDDVDESKNPDDERLACLLLQFGVHNVKDLPHLQLQENELELFAV